MHDNYQEKIGFVGNALAMCSPLLPSPEKNPLTAGGVERRFNTHRMLETARTRALAVLMLRSGRAGGRPREAVTRFFDPRSVLSFGKFY